MTVPPLTTRVRPTQAFGSNASVAPAGRTRPSPGQLRQVPRRGAGKCGHGRGFLLVGLAEAEERLRVEAVHKRRQGPAPAFEQRLLRRADEVGERDAGPQDGQPGFVGGPGHGGALGDDRVGLAHRDRHLHLRFGVAEDREDLGRHQVPLRDHADRLPSDWCQILTGTSGCLVPPAAAERVGDIGRPRCPAIQPCTFGPLVDYFSVSLQFSLVIQRCREIPLCYRGSTSPPGFMGMGRATVSPPSMLAAPSCEAVPVPPATTQPHAR